MSAPAADRLEGLLEQLEGLRDVHARELAREAVRAVLDLHAGGLARVLQIVGSAGTGATEQLARDQLVGNLLLLHGLHPQGLEERVRQGLEQLGAQLQAQEASVELVALESGVARVELRPGKACQGTRARLRESIESALEESAPDLVRVEVSSPVEPAAFVPLARLSRARPSSETPHG